MKLANNSIKSNLDGNSQGRFPTTAVLDSPLCERVLVAL